MKIKIQTLGIAALLPAAILTFSSCSSEPKGASEGSSVTTVQQGVPGGVRVDTYKETATVTAIDRANRKLTLVDPNGTKSTVVCGPGVANFGQIEVGDQVKATVTQQLVVGIRNPGEPARDGTTSTVALAPIGAKPGAVVANTDEMTAQIQALDLKHRKATLLFPDGTTKTFEVRKDIDMTKHHVGDQVVFRSTETVAISVEKP